MTRTQAKIRCIPGAGLLRRHRGVASLWRLGPGCPLPRTWSVLLVGAALLLARPQAGAQESPGAASRESENPVSVDSTCDACTDFYQFANQDWLQSTTRPAARSWWGVFFEVQERNDSLLHQMMENFARSLDALQPGSNRWMIGAFYSACMDTLQIERLGTRPLLPLLNLVSEVQTADDVAHAIGILDQTNLLAPFSVSIGPDPRDSDSVLVSIGQGGLGLPARDYYFREDEQSVELRRAYMDHLAKIFSLLGEPPEKAAREAERVFGIETQLAEASMTREQLRDPGNTYHKLPIESVQEITPHFDWRRYFDQQGAPGPIPVVNVRQPDWFRAFDRMLVSMPVADWKAYLRWRVVRGSDEELPSAFVHEFLHFNQRVGGAHAQAPRWRECTGSTRGVLEGPVAQEFVRIAFAPESKARAHEMVETLRRAFRERIIGLTWLSDGTKAHALAKLDALSLKIGYPEKWPDYSGREVYPDRYAENLMLARQHWRRRGWESVGESVDKSGWRMSPSRVNAQYVRANNEVVFPAAVLQPPFFDSNGDIAANYGAIGAIIGHEMTHAFDDRGRRYDADGNLREWWTPEDTRRFNARAERLVRQYSAYIATDTLRVNGRLTLGENIADLGGLAIAYDALQHALKDQPSARVGGYTPEQRFFLAYAQTYRELQSPEFARRRVSVDPHAPGRWRVNGVLANMPAFRAAWGCGMMDDMVRPADQVVTIW